MIYNCQTCKSFETMPLGKLTQVGNSIKFGANRIPVSNNCANCNAFYQVGGPFYSGPLHSHEFLDKLIPYIKENKLNYGTNVRMIGMLSVMREELPNVLYYSLSTLCSVIGANTPKIRVFRYKYLPRHLCLVLRCSMVDF